ncbi:MAG: MerR family transcriptional regulator [Fretibacterium sp.]|nr:MerR family transcriptional regulator [Fretibacterium sp.]
MLYTVGEMAKIMGLTASTLRYYDKEGLLPFLKRSRGRIRMFDESDYEALQVIACLKEAGLSIKDIKVFMAMAKEGDATLAQRLELFQKRRKVLEERIRGIRQALDLICYKCWYYETAQAAGTEEAVKSLPFEKVPKKYRTAKKRLCTVSQSSAGTHEGASPDRP